MSDRASLIKTHIAVNNYDAVLAPHEYTHHF